MSSAAAQRACGSSACAFRFRRRRPPQRINPPVFRLPVVKGRAAGDLHFLYFRHRLILMGLKSQIKKPRGLCLFIKSVSRERARPKPAAGRPGLGPVTPRRQPTFCFAAGPYAFLSRLLFRDRPGPSILRSVDEAAPRRPGLLPAPELAVYLNEHGQGYGEGQNVRHGHRPEHSVEP